MSINQRGKMGRLRLIDPDRPRGLPTAGRVPFREGGFFRGLRSLFRPRRPAEDFVQVGDKTHQALFKMRRG